MLKKLLKYDLKWCFKPLVVFYILAICLSVITKIVESFEQSLIILILDKIFSGATIGVFIGILINNFMRVWARIITNIYKDESYLTHTLPVSKNKIFLSKVLTAIITLITSFIVIIACIAIFYLNEESWTALKNSMEKSAIYFNTSVFGLISVLAFTIFFEFLFMIMTGILGIIIGYRSNNLKIVKSIFIGFVIYGLLSALSLGIIYAIGLVNPEIMEIFKNLQVSSEVMKIALCGAICIYAIYNLIIYFVGKKLLNKGVNVD